MANNKNSMKVLVLGSGGREHALCHAIRKSEMLQELYCAPGSDAISEIATIADIDILDGKVIADFCADEQIELVICGPEAPLVAGVADILRSNDILVVGPSEVAAQLEGSKAFTKKICDAAGIATAAWAEFNWQEQAKAKEYIEKQGAPLVVKADGLAAGKGVTVAMSKQEALDAVDKIYDGHFVDNKDEHNNDSVCLIIEEFLEGEEISFFALCDGKQAIYLGAAQDHKRAYDGDKGPNTGGMGCYAPAPAMNPYSIDKIMNDVINPTIEQLHKQGASYQGILFAGLMVTDSGAKLLEYNIRFGDPEAQVILPLIADDVLELLWLSARGKLDEFSRSEIAFHKSKALCVVMAANGYPESYKQGTVIAGLDEAQNIVTADDDRESIEIIIYHAGTKRGNNREWLANGGRVLGICAVAEDFTHAKSAAYQVVRTVKWADGFFRGDIGWRV